MINRLIMTVGLPRSGKSTWSRLQGCPIVNPDSIRLALYGENFRIQGEDMVWTIAKYMVKSLFFAGHRTVILDATNTIEERRWEWKSAEWETVLHLVPTSVDVCHERAIMDGRTELLPVITRMADRYDPPHQDWKTV